MTSTADADVLILGAGPAGSTLARLLTTAGLSVVVLDRLPGPSFKIGESLLPEGVRLCLEMGLGPALESHGFLEKHAARFILGEDGREDTFSFADALHGYSAPHAYQVKRIEFDALLQEFAEASGARIVRGVTVEAVDVTDAVHVGVTCRDGRAFTARYLVDATGPASLLARAFGLRKSLPDLNKIALFAHFDGIPRRSGKSAGDILILWSQTGWFWLIPFSDGTASVGVVGDPQFLQSMGSDDQARFDALCDQSSTHRAHLGGRKQLFPLQRRADYSFRCEPLTGDRFLLAGDAAGFIDPIFSSGVFLAQKSAFLACDAIAPALLAGGLPDESSRQTYEQKVRLGMDRFLGLVRQFYDTRFMDNTVRCRQRPQFKKALISLLAGDIYHEENVLIRLGGL